MFISASIAVLFLVSVNHVEAACTDNTFLCSDCTTLVACFGGTEYPIPCATGQVCGNDGKDATVDGCFDADDSSNTKLSQCSCDAAATAPSYMADALSDDAQVYLACLPGDAAPQSLTCTGTDVFLEGQIPPCGEAPPTTTAGPTTTTTTPTPFECSATGFAADPNDCSKYWLCTADDDDSPSELSCSTEGEVFNDATLSCFDPCDDSAETFSCNGASGGVADTIDCTIFHICVNGAPIGQPVPCADGDGFNPATMACENGYTCTENPCLKCPDSETTTVTTTT